MPRIKIPNYKVFKKEIFDNISSVEKNYLFYWSLTDISSWEEVPPSYYPDAKTGHEKVLNILKRSPSIKKYIDKDSEFFMKRFVMGEFLANFLLAAELEQELEDWSLDLVNIQKAEFPDFIFSKPDKKVHIEIKGMISASNLKQRINDDVMPHIEGDGYGNFLLLLLFLVCPNEDAERVNQLVEGYYIYEDLIAQGEGDNDSRKVFCQCFTEEKDEEGKYSLERLANRITNGYFNTD